MPIEWIEGTSKTAISLIARRDLVRRATEQHPHAPAGWYALAETHFFAEDFADVVLATSRAVELAPPTVGQLRIYIGALIALDRPGEALDALERHAPATMGPRLRALRGEAFRLLGRLAEARIEFDAALAALPREVAAGRGLSKMLTAQGAWQDLLDVIAGIEAHGELSMTLHVAKGRALRRLGRYAEARALIDFDRLGRVRTIAVPDGFDTLSSFNAALLAELASPLHSSLSDRPRLRLVGGTQIEDLEVSKGRALRTLFATIRSAAEDYFQAPPVGSEAVAARCAPKRAELITWALVLGPDDFQARHYHAEAAVAGVYYVAAPAESLNETDVDGALVIPDSPEDLEGGDSLVRYIQPQPGRLVLFPGYLPHRTLPTRRPGERVSIAFNVVSAEQR